MGVTIELLDLADLKRNRYNSQALRIKTVLLVYNIVINETTGENILELTDFTSPHQNSVNKFVVIKDSLANHSLKQIKSKYGIGEYLKVGKVVMVKVIAEVTNDESDFRFTLEDIEPINMIEEIENLYCNEDKFLFFKKVRNLTEKLKTQGLWNNVKNKDEILNLLNDFKKIEFQSKFEASSSQSTPSSPSNSSLLFTKPNNNNDTSQIIANSQFEYSINDSLSDSQTIEINIESDESDLDNDELIQATERKQDNEESYDSIPDNAFYSDDQDLSKDDTQVLQHSIKSSFDEIESRLESRQQDNELSSEYDGSNAIEAKLSKYDNYKPNVSFDFCGYIVGVQPLNIIPFGRSFKTLPSTTNFRILISNIKPNRKTIFQANKNCIPLEFKSKASILRFFGVDDLESFTENKRELLDNFNLLLKQGLEKKLDFKIIKRKVRLSTGHQMIWESEFSLDDFMKQLQ